MECIDINDLEKKYSQAIEIEDKLRIATSICSYYWKKSEFDKATAIGNEALYIAKDINDYCLLYEINTVMGLNFHVQGNYTQAKYFFETALQIAVDSDNSVFLIRSYINLGNSEYYLHNISESLLYYQKGVDLAEKLDHVRYLARLYNNLAGNYSELKQFDKAIVYYKKSLKCNEESSNLSCLYFNLGNLYKAKNDLALALGYYKKAKKMFVNEQQYHNIVHTLDYIGKIFFIKKKYRDSINSLIEGLKLCDKYNFKQAKHSILISLADNYVALKEYENAKKYFSLFLQIKDSLEDKRILSDFYKSFITFNKTIDNIYYAYELMEEYLELKESLFNEDIAKRISLITVKFEYEQNKKELELSRIRNHELVKYQKVIEEQKDELIKLLKSKDNILSMISHDLKNYIGSINSLLDIVMIKDESLKNNKYLKTISEVCDKSIALVKDILYLNRIDSNDYILDLRNYDINLELQKVQGKYSLLANKKDIEIKYNYFPEASLCKLNIDSFYRIIDNIVTNAIKFTRPKGQIQIKTTELIMNNIKYFRVHVLDNGIGIPASRLSEIFKKHSAFGRKGTAGEESTGLGLFIVKRLVDLHSGFIDVKSVEHEGTEFIISFPVIHNEV